MSCVCRWRGLKERAARRPRGTKCPCGQEDVYNVDVWRGVRGGPTLRVSSSTYLVVRRLRVKGNKTPH